MNLESKTKTELIAICRSLNIPKYSSKNKSELIQLIQSANHTADDRGVPKAPTANPPTTTSNTSFTFVDLFCGIGGFHVAMSSMGGECVFACDMDADCRDIYTKNYGMPCAGDITQISIETIPPFDVLCAGFPCQPFSKAGAQRGFADNRGNLFFRLCEIVQHHRPSYLILENVRNLSTHDDGNTWNVIRTNIDDLGYHTYHDPLILNVLHFNIPQNRERVIILCKRKDLGELPCLPSISKTPKLSLTRSVADFIHESDREYNRRFQLTGKMKEVEYVWNEFIRLLIQHSIEMPKYPLWTDWWDIDLATADSAFYTKYTNWIDKNREFYEINRSVLQPWLEFSRKNKQWTGAVRKFEWQAGDLLDTDGMHTVLWTARGSGIRVKRPDYIPTLVAMSMVPVYGCESRKLSPRELLRLQSFPESFVFNEKSIYKQVGNAVNTTMIEQCARFLMNRETNGTPL